MGSKTTVQSNTPWAPAQPYILQNLQDTKNTYDTNQPTLQNYATQQQATYGALAPGAMQGITGAQNLVNQNLSGANLNGNPYLEGIIGATNRDVTNGVNSQFNAAGRFGSGANQGILASKLAEADNNLRYQNYSTERGYQQNAINDAQNLMGGATGLLNNAAQLPWVGVAAQNGGTTGLTNGYGTSTKTENSSLGSTLTGLAGAGLSAAGAAGGFGSLFSDARVKNIERQAGIDPNTGLPLYDYTYKGDPLQTPQTGVMAQDVAKVRPDAVGQTPQGIMTVDYGKLGLPNPSDLAAINAKTPYIPTPGVDGFIERLAGTDPRGGGPGAGLAKLGTYLMAASTGSPFEALGKGLLASREDQSKTATEARDFGLKAQEAAGKGAYYQALAADKTAPAAPRIIQRRDGSVISIDPATGTPTILSGPVAAPEKLIATAEGYLPQSQAQGKMPYAKPFAPPRASTAAPKYQVSGGKVLKWVP